MTVLERNDQNGDFWGRLNSTLVTLDPPGEDQAGESCGGRAAMAGRPTMKLRLP